MLLRQWRTPAFSTLALQGDENCELPTVPLTSEDVDWNDEEDASYEGESAEDSRWWRHVLQYYPPNATMAEHVPAE